MILILLSGLKLIKNQILKGLKDEKYYGVAIFNKDFSKNAMSKTQKVVMDSKKQK